MSEAEILERIEAIRGSDDDAAQHRMEDELHRDFLTALVTGAVPVADMPKLAALVLSTSELPFSRGHE